MPPHKADLFLIIILLCYDTIEEFNVDSEAHVARKNKTEETKTKQTPVPS